MSTKENINNTISRDEILKDIKFRLADVSDTKEILDIYAPYITDTAITFEYDIPSIEEFRGQHFMRACRIDAGHQFPAGARCKGRDHLIAVMAGVFRAPDGSHRAVFPHQLTDSGFFLFELLGIIQPQHRTAAALFCFQSALHRISFRHLTKQKKITILQIEKALRQAVSPEGF